MSGLEACRRGRRRAARGAARVVYVVFAFEPYILHECVCGQCELAARSYLCVCVCVSLNIIAYLRAMRVCVC